MTRYVPYWLDDPNAPAVRPPLVSDERCDLVIVGAGFTGLWTALLAKQGEPDLEVVVVEARSVAWGGSGRNGGFCDASLTHGLSNGLSRFPEEIGRLEQLGLENLLQIKEAVGALAIDCNFELNGTIDVATKPWQVGELQEACEAATSLGHDARLLDRAEIQDVVRSPTYLAGLQVHGRTAMLNPAHLAWGLAAACEEHGVRLFEQTEVHSIDKQGSQLLLRTAHGTITAERAVMATNASRPLLRRVRPYILPVYDYVLVTEPLSPDQMAAIGWRGREGLGDAGNQFHYYRRTADDRILFGGYDAIYHFGNGIGDALERRPATFAKLFGHLLETFPGLEGVAITHAWGGAIDTCSRFCAFYGTAFAGRAAYAAGFTGLGVGASRFAAQVMLELIGERGELASLKMVRTKPLPFPPEPLRFLVVEATRRSLARADEAEGRRNPWLRLLDRLGLGFDS